MLTSEKNQQLSLLQKQFQQLYGAGEVHIFRAPARINILGEHIDYVSYLPTASLPFGSHEHEMIMMLRANDTGVVRGASLHEAFAPFSFPVSEGADACGQSWTEYLYNRTTPPSHWSNYVKGAVFFALQKHALQNARGFDFCVASTIPPQGGSSSSSALVVLSGVAIRAVNHINYSLPELAQDSATAEWYVGTRGGALDHTTICLAQKNHALHLQYADHHTALVPLPDKGFRWVTFFSHAADKGREIMLEYNERAAVARLLIPAIIAQWKITDPTIFSLWDDCKDFWRAGVRPIDGVAAVLNHYLPKSLSLAEAQQNYAEAFDQCHRAFPALVKERLQQPLKIRDRALHHIGEIKRVSEAINILRQKNDPNTKMRALGQLLDAAHASLRDLYEVSTPQVNQLYDILKTDPQVYGARLIGGGFGGNVLALTTRENVAALVARVQHEYYAPQNRHGVREGAVMISTPGDGVSEIL